MIPLNKVYTPFESRVLVDEVLCGGNLGKNSTGYGEYVEKFEDELKKEIGCQHVICTNSGTSALFLAIKVRLAKEDFVSMSPSSMEATTLSVLHNDKKIYWSPYHNTSNDIITWVGGGATKDGIFHNGVQDCAHAMWSKYDKDTMVGNSSAICCFSTQTRKILQTGDGGFITTNVDSEAQILRELVWYGMKRDKYFCGHVDRVGYKMGMNNLAAAIGLGMLQCKDEILKRYSDIHEAYFSGVNSEHVEFECHNAFSNKYMCFVYVKDSFDFCDYMREKGVECGIFYRPNYYSPVFPIGNCATAESNYRTKVAIPCYYLLTDEEIEKIIKEINNYA